VSLPLHRCRDLLDIMGTTTNSPTEWAWRSGTAMTSGSSPTIVRTSSLAPPGLTCTCTPTVKSDAEATCKLLSPGRASMIKLVGGTHCRSMEGSRSAGLRFPVSRCALSGSTHALTRGDNGVVAPRCAP